MQRALGRVVDRADRRAFQEARAALHVLRGMARDAIPVHAACDVCRDVPDVSHALSTAAHPASLPAACSRLIPRELDDESRCSRDIRCPGCGTGYVYERGYEYLAGGSEDEETLTRLYLPALLDRIAAHLEAAAKGRSADLAGACQLLASALRTGLSASPAAPRRRGP